MNKQIIVTTDFSLQKGKAKIGEIWRGINEET